MQGEHCIQALCGRSILPPRGDWSGRVQGMRLSRRAVVKTSAIALAGAWLSARTPFANAEPVVLRGRLKQSVSRWPYGKIPLPEFARAVADMGLTAVDLLE